MNLQNKLKKAGKERNGWGVAEALPLFPLGSTELVKKLPFLKVAV